MFFSFQGRNWPGSWTRAAGLPSSRVRRAASRARRRFGVEQLESRWLLSATSVSATFDSKGFAPPGDVASTLTSVNVLFLPVVATEVNNGEEPFDDFAAALELPNAPSVQVKGSHSPGDSPDMLMIPVDAGTGVLRLSLKSGADGKPLAEGLRVLDTLHRELASSTPGPNTTSIDVRLPLWGQNATEVYVQIAWQAPTGSPTWDLGQAGETDPAQAVPYVLEVTRVPSPPVSPSVVANAAAVLASWEQFVLSGSQASPTPSSPPMVVDVSIPRVGPGPTDSVPHPPTQPQDPPDVPGPPGIPAPGTVPAPSPLPVPVGPLPMRSAAPLGGVLGMSDPVPAVDPHEPARADLATFDPASDLPGIGLVERQVVPVAAPDADPAPQPAVVVRGPGGLPLLATALIAGPMGPPSESPVAVQPPDGEPAIAPPVMAPVQLSAVASEAGSPITDACRSEEPPVRARRTRRASALPGMTLALALGVGLMLPDLVAAFQLTSPARPRVRLALIRRALRNGLG